MKRRYLAGYIKECGEVAKSKGWDKPSATVGEDIALMHSELSEALEEYRKDNNVYNVYMKNNKPEGLPVELADVLIRIFHFCHKWQIPIETYLQSKIEYNKTRPFRHGGKIL